MINKNKFSIKDTKKVLHKVGKKWVVVSAVLLGLAAGGAAVTTANADTTNASANHATPAETSVASNSAAAQPAHTARLGADFGAAPNHAATPANANNPKAAISAKINGEVANAKGKISGAKNLVNQDAHEVDLPNAVKLANRSRLNGNSSAFDDLINVASNAVANVNTEKVGSTSASASTSGTLFNMLSEASNDVNLLRASNSSVSDNPKLDKIANGFTKFNSLLSSSVSLPLNDTVSESTSIGISVSKNTITNGITKLSGIRSEVDTLAGMYNPETTVSDLRNDINNRINELNKFKRTNPTANLSDFVTAADTAKHDVDGFVAANRTSTTLSDAVIATKIATKKAQQGVDGFVVANQASTTLSDAVTNNSKNPIELAMARKFENEYGTHTKLSDLSHDVANTNSKANTLADTLANKYGQSTKLSDLTNKVNSTDTVAHQLSAKYGANTTLSVLINSADEDLGYLKKLNYNDTLNDVQRNADTVYNTVYPKLQTLLHEFGNKDTKPISVPVTVPVTINSTVSSTVSDVVNNGLNVSSTANLLASDEFSSAVSSLETSGNAGMSKIVSSINDNTIPKMLGITNTTDKAAVQKYLPQITEPDAINDLKNYLNNNSKNNGSLNYNNLANKAKVDAGKLLGSMYNIKFSAPASYTASDLAKELSPSGEIYSDVSDVLSGASLTSARADMAKANSAINEVLNRAAMLNGQAGLPYKALMRDASQLPSTTDNSNLASSVYNNIYSNDTNPFHNNNYGTKLVNELDEIHNNRASEAASFINTQFVQPASTMSATLSGMMSASSRASSAINSASAGNEKNEEISLLSSGSNNVVSKVNSGISDYIANVSGAYTPSLATDTFYANNKAFASMTGVNGEKFTANNNTLSNAPKGFNISGQTITFGNSDATVSLTSSASTPTNKTVSATIDYVNIDNNNNVVDSTTISSNVPEDDNDASENIITAPSGYQLVHSNNNVALDGRTYDVEVEPINNGGQPNNTTNNSGNNTNSNASNPSVLPDNFASSVAASLNGNNSASASSNASTSANASSNNVAPETKKHAANYAKVIKALQLHTNPNFTKKNAVAVVKPNTTFKIEKAVKAHNGALRYEVRYNKKNYFITANKHFVNAYYKAAKHANHSVKNYVHYRYAKVIKALQLHTHAKFTKRNGVKVVRPGVEFHINHIVKNHGLVRYEVRYNHKNYFITANHHYIVNAYVQKYNFRKHGHKAVRVIKHMNEYRKLSFAKHNLVRHVYRGSVLSVKKVITIANGEMTRLQLTNGRYVTANKDFVKPIR